MIDAERPSEELSQLVDAYLSGSADEQGVQHLEELLRGNESARHYFVLYCRMHTDLQEIIRAGRATKTALETLKNLEKPRADQSSSALSRTQHHRRLLSFAAVAAAVLVLAFVIYKWHEGSADSPIAWIVNAQDCRWNAAGVPDQHMLPGKKLVLEKGLAEISFASGATILIEGPARVDLISFNAARLQSGKLTARVPQVARGFWIEMPRAKVVDLGTEFGLAVSPDGVTNVYVFKGEIQAFTTGAQTASSQPVPIKEMHGARIDSAGIVKKDTPPEIAFVRQIPQSKALVPKTVRFDFSRDFPGTLRDANGLGTGLTQRLPGTGSNLPLNDSNLKLNTALQQLELTTSNSDINRKYQLAQGEYLGFRLLDMGFNAADDFSISATIPNIPEIKALGQFGLYAGARSDCCIRGGLISRHDGGYKLFLVNNHGGEDSNAHFVGVQSSGEDMRMTLRRESGKYSLTVEKLTTGGSSTVSVKHPDFLDDERDLYVGLFGANTQSEVPTTLYIREVVVTISAPTIQAVGVDSK